MFMFSRTHGLPPSASGGGHKTKKRSTGSIMTRSRAGDSSASVPPLQLTNAPPASSQRDPDGKKKKGNDQGREKLSGKEARMGV
jgi:hypothetical protein